MGFSFSFLFGRTINNAFAGGRIAWPDRLIADVSFGRNPVHPVDLLIPSSYIHGVMAKRSGSADLPLHGGRVPPWLATRMSMLGAIITQAIVHHYGRDEFLQRLAHPFWFQSFGAVMGMDWHSSGITTSVIGALKRGLAPLQNELGIYVCGGRGQHSRKTPDELTLLGERVGFDGAALDAREPAGRKSRQCRRAGRLRSLSAWLLRHATTASGRSCSRA